MPAAGNEADFRLAPVLNASAIPSQEVFNPERSCQFVLAKRFLPACAKGASQDCCDVVADQWRLSSSAPFSSCFCQPSFWQVGMGQAVDVHAAHVMALSSCLMPGRSREAHTPCSCVQLMRAVPCNAGVCELHARAVRR